LFPRKAFLPAETGVPSPSSSPATICFGDCPDEANRLIEVANEDPDAVTGGNDFESADDDPPTGDDTVANALRQIEEGREGHASSGRGELDRAAVLRIFPRISIFLNTIANFGNL
jgi:hypothetical protein